MLHHSLPLFDGQQEKIFDHYRIVSTEHTQLLAQTKPLSPQLIRKISQLMRAEPQNVGATALLSNYNLSSGYTYFGQFVTHDIGTGHNLGSLDARLNLLGLYGMGPRANPFLYVHYPDDIKGVMGMTNAFPLTDQAFEYFRHVKLRIVQEGIDQFDVPRASNGLAVMADSRNDQNFLVNQMHCAWARYHNAIAEWLMFVNIAVVESRQFPNAIKIDPDTLFRLTKALVKQSYHRVIANDYLKKLVGSSLVDELFKDNHFFKMFHPELPPVLMPEFNLAAMRLGHSQIQEVYLMNEQGGRVSIFTKIRGEDDLSGARKHPKFDFRWSVFFDLKPGQTTAQRSAAINHQVAAPLAQLAFLPRNNNNLIALNVNRSASLPTGFQLAQAAGFTPITQAQLDSIWGNVIQVEDLPLWTYILLEAEIQAGGQRLGQLGSQIIAEQLIWVLKYQSTKHKATSAVGYNHIDWADHLPHIFDDLHHCFGDKKIVVELLQQLGFSNNQFDMANIIGMPSTVQSLIEAQMPDLLRKIKGSSSQGSSASGIIQHIFSN
jgi:Animal haem peroxidase